MRREISGCTSAHNCTVTTHASINFHIIIIFNYNTQDTVCNSFWGTLQKDHWTPVHITDYCHSIAFRCHHWTLTLIWSCHLQLSRTRLAAGQGHSRARLCRTSSIQIHLTCWVIFGFICSDSFTLLSHFLPEMSLDDKRNLNSKQQLFGLKRRSHRCTLADNTKLHGRQVLISHLFYSEAKKKKKS